MAVKNLILLITGLAIRLKRYKDVATFPTACFTFSHSFSNTPLSISRFGDERSSRTSYWTVFPPFSGIIAIALYKNS